MSERHQFRLGVLSDLLDTDEFRLTDPGPTMQGARLRPVGACTLKLTATCTDPFTALQYANNEDDTERELDIPKDMWDDVVVGDATWTFDMNIRGRYTSMDYVGKIDVQHTDLTSFGPTHRQDQNRGIGFEGDFITWDPCPPAFKEQSCRYLLFCAEIRKYTEYDQSTGTWEIEWKGRLFRGGDDVDDQKTNAARKRKKRSEAVVTDG